MGVCSKTLVTKATGGKRRLVRQLQVDNAYPLRREHADAEAAAAVLVEHDAHQRPHDTAAAAEKGTAGGNIEQRKLVPRSGGESGRLQLRFR